MILYSLALSPVLSEKGSINPCIVKKLVLILLISILCLFGVQTADLNLVYKDSSPTTPLIFVLSTGTDPAADLYKFAEEMRFGKKLSAISLGQGQVSHGCDFSFHQNFSL